MVSMPHSAFPIDEHPDPYRPFERQHGFGFLIATGALAVVSLLLGAWYTAVTGEEESRAVEQTHAILIQTAEALYAYRLAHDNTWPSALSDLATQAPALAASARNGVGQPLTLAPQTPTTPLDHPTAPLVIRTDLLTAGLARRVRAEFPGQARAGSGSVVEIEIPVPGHEPATRVQELLVRDGTRTMRGTLDMDGHAIHDVGNFRIHDRLTIGRDLQVGNELRVGDGITIGGETLDIRDTRFLLQMAALNCGPDEFLFIAGGVPSCRRIDRTASPASTPTPIPTPVSPSVPGISIRGGPAITEGEAAVFTLTPTVALPAAVTVVITVVDDAAGDFVASDDEGRQTLVLPAGRAGATWSVPTVDDSLAEADGPVTVRLRSGSGYVPDAPTSATVTVRDNDHTPGIPEVTISGGAAVIEGEAAMVTLQTDRAPAVDLTIQLDVSEVGAGDFLTPFAEGRHTVTLVRGTTTVPYAIPTYDDARIEADGAISARVAFGTGYAVGSPSTATVNVRDNDRVGTPAVTITGGAAITEGEAAVFTVRATPTPITPLTIRLDVSEQGDFLASGSEGHQTVTMASGATRVQYSVLTMDDTVDEPDGAVSVQVTTSTGYTTGSSATATVVVRDNEDSGCPRPDGLHPDAAWVGGTTCESRCGPVRVRNVLTLISDVTTRPYTAWWQLTPASACPRIRLGGSRRGVWRSRCDPAAAGALGYRRWCQPWAEHNYRTDEGACGVEVCLTQPLVFDRRRGQGEISTLDSRSCPRPGVDRFDAVDWGRYTCPEIPVQLTDRWTRCGADGCAVR